MKQIEQVQEKISETKYTFVKKKLKKQNIGLEWLRNVFQKEKKKLENLWQECQELTLIFGKILSSLNKRKQQNYKIQNSKFKTMPKKQETMLSKKTAAKSEQSTQKFLNIEGIRDGIIVLKNKALRSIVMCSSINFALMSQDEQKGKVFAYQEFLNSLSFPIEIVVQSRKLNISRYLEKVKEAERMQDNELLRMQTAEYGEFIKSLVELTNITTNHYYVVVPYSPPGVEATQGIIDKIKNIVSPAKEISKELTSFEKQKEKLLLRINSIINGLSGVGIQAATLNTQEVVELLYSWYNPGESATQVLGELEKLKVEQA